MLPKEEAVKPTKFTIRVYGLLLEGEQVLISDEFYKGIRFTKFPGGGLQPGESTLEAVQREFREELQLEIAVSSHFYTTDFVVQSAFEPEAQVLAIYYLVEARSAVHLPQRALNPALGKDEVFRWVPLSQLQAARDLSFAVDQKVLSLLQQRFPPAP